MSNTRSCTMTTLEWEGLLAACREHEALLPDLLAERRSLELSLGKARFQQTLQESHTAARQEATQRMHQALAEGKETAERLRDIVKSKLGRRNEGLVQFRVAPLRKPRRKAKAAITPITPAEPV
jgi:DNA-binding protein H-NS